MPTTTTTTKAASDKDGGDDGDGDGNGSGSTLVDAKDLRTSIESKEMGLPTAPGSGLQWGVGLEVIDEPAADPAADPAGSSAGRRACWPRRPILSDLSNFFFCQRP